MQYPIGSEQRPLHVAIIGAGPAAFYAANELLKQKDFYTHVDMFERLPTPYGLVRGGVAPDHQKIKNVTKIYRRIASLSHFQYWGNVTFGEDICVEELLCRFDSIIYAAGAQSDRKMGIPGENLTGSYSAVEFVGWYNGHPDYRDLTLNLSVEQAVVIGVGNVAIDVARILAKTPEELANTDIPDYALEALKTSQIKDIYVIARRGPVQASYTPIELREMLKLEETVAIVDPEALKLDTASQHILGNTNQKDIRRNMEILQEMAKNTGQKKSKRLHFMFHYSPVKLNETHSRVSGIKLVKNQLIQVGEQIKAKPTDELKTLPAGLVFRSIGYEGVALPNVPFDEKKGIIPNHHGRVIDNQTEKIHPREYVVGWMKRGPSGVIGTNKPDAVETVRLLLEDYKSQYAEPSEFSTPEAIGGWLHSKEIAFVTFDDWQILDRYEMDSGSKKGKPREKITLVAEMLSIIQQKSAVLLDNTLSNES